MLNILRGATGVFYVVVFGIGIAIIAVVLSERDHNDLAWTLWQETTGSDAFTHDKNNLRISLLVFFWIFIAVGSASVIIGAIGILSAIFHRKRWLFLLGAISLLILALLELAGGIAVLAREKDSTDAVDKFVLEAFAEQGADYANIQQRFKCCGVTNNPCPGPATQPSCSDVIYTNFMNVLIWCRWIALAIVVFEILICIVASAMHIVMHHQRKETLHDLRSSPHVSVAQNNWAD